MSLTPGQIVTLPEGQAVLITRLSGNENPRFQSWRIIFIHDKDSRSHRRNIEVNQPTGTARDE